MTEYIVRIQERVTHSVVVEAASEDAAIELGYKLLTDGMSPEEEKARDYDIESDGYTGYHYTEEWR